MNTIPPAQAKIPSPLPEEINPNLISTQSNKEKILNLLKKDNISKPGLWFNILWSLIIENVLVILCVLTYILMMTNETSRSIIVAIYIFFAIFWITFPYYLRCIMMYEIAGITSCNNRLVYSLIGTVFWCIALFIYN